MSTGVVKIVRSHAKAVNYQVIQHGFARIGVYTLDHRQCLKNCDKDPLLQYESHVIDDIVDKVSTLATLSLDIVNGGELLHAGIPFVPNNDRRTMDKYQRSQPHQHAVMLSNQSSRRRRKEWKDRSRNKNYHVVEEDEHAIVDEIDNVDGVGKKRKKRAPNRSKEVIEEEKRLKKHTRGEKVQVRELKNGPQYEESCNDNM